MFDMLRKTKRHWAALENFASQKVAIAEKFYRNIDRLLEGGIWAEVTIAHNHIDEDNYAFYVLKTYAHSTKPL